MVILKPRWYNFQPPHGTKLNRRLQSDYKAVKTISILNDYTNKRAIIRKQPKNNIKLIDKSKEYKIWKNFQSKVKGHYYIYGNIIERLDKENKYILTVDSMVIHEPVDYKISDQIRNEFIKIFPKEISFYEKLEVSGFKFTVDIMYLSIRYITGIAAFISGDPKTAIKLHDGLKNQIMRFMSPLPSNLKQILSNVDEMISAEKYSLAHYNYYNKGNVREAKIIIDDCLKVGINIYNHLILKSYILFKEDRDVLEAIKVINLAQKNAKHNYTWIYNKAFILMYIGKFRRGVIYYKKIANISYINEDNYVNQCIEFNHNLLKSEPDKIQCLFIMGYLYWKKKSNLPLALENFEQLIQKANNLSEYLYLSNISKSYMKKVKAEMKLD